MDLALTKEFHQACVEGVEHTLKVMCQVNATEDKSFTGFALQYSTERSIAGMIAVVNRNIVNRLSICFPESTYLAAMEQVLGERPPTLLAEKDGASEMMNIIFGHAKKILNERGQEIQLALPRVVTGSNSSLNLQLGPLHSLVRFDSPIGRFHLAIGVSVPKEKVYV